MNSAQFQAGLKSAQVNLSNFGKTVAKGLGLVSIAAAGAAAALGYAVKGAIDHADELSKASQKIGVSVEALSQLEYAAKLSDVSLEQLTTGLRQFSKAIVEASSNGKSGPAEVFKALGVAIKDASGNLRSNEQVFADVADRFSKMENGALKTSLAMQLFGKSGADLIPLSNSAAVNAEAFNDTLTKIGGVLQGVTNKIMEAALPALQSLANTLASPEFAKAAEVLATTLVGAFDAVVQAVVATTNAISGFLDWLKSLDNSSGSGAPLLNGLLPGEKLNFADRIRNSGTSPDLTPSFWDAFGMNPDGTFKVQQGGSSSTAPVFTPVISGADAAKTAIVDLMAGVDKAIPKFKTLAETVGDTLTSAFTGFADSLLNGVPAGEAFIGMLGNLAKQLADAAIGNLISSIFGGGGFGGLFKSAPKLGIDFGMGLYAKGGVTDRPAIFGDNGPEAAVPLPDGRSIPVTINGNQQQPVNNFYGVPSQPEVRQNNTGGYDYIFKEFEGRIKNNMAKGQYRGFGVTPGMKKS